MLAKETTSWLSHYPQLASINDPAWLDAIDNAQLMQVPAGTTVFRPGDPCTGLLFLVEGSVRVFMTAESGREIILYRLTNSEICVLTLTTLLQEADYPVEAITETETLAVALPTAQFRRAFAGSQKFQDFILGKMARRLHDTLLLVQEVAFERLDMRLACLLYRRFQVDANPVITLTHQQIAQELGTTREVVSRMLKELERRQCVRLHRGNVELIDEQILQQLSHMEKNAKTGPLSRLARMVKGR